MRKYVPIGLLAIMVVLSACVLISVKKPVSPVPPTIPQKKPPLRPDLSLYVYAKGEQIINSDGTITIGEINLPNGKTILLKLAIMTLSRARGDTQEPDYTEYDALIAMVSEVINREPYNAIAYIQRASLLFSRGRQEDLNRVVQDCNAALKIDDSKQEAYYIRAMVSAKMKDFDQAKSDLITILNIREYECIGIYYLLASVYKSEKKYDLAIEMLEKVVEIDPDFIDAADVLWKLRNP